MVRKNETKAEKIYKTTKMYAKTWITNWHEANPDKELDLSKYQLPIYYDDDEAIYVRTLNAMYKLLEKDIRQQKMTYEVLGRSFYTEEDLAGVKNALDGKMKEIRDFQKHLDELFG